MEKSHTYCPTRRRLEERGWMLISKLASVSGRLINLIGKHQAFIEAKDECNDLRTAITESQTALRDHRAMHNC